MKVKATKWIVTAGLMAAGGPLHAHHGNSGEHAATQIAQANPDVAQGEVRKVDRENRKITLKHGEIRSLDMPPMTMVFRVRDAAMLDGLKAGDKVKFSAEKIDGAYAVTAIEAVR
jgi:Cu/Ag efflux protein CusF